MTAATVGLGAESSTRYLTLSVAPAVSHQPDGSPTNDHSACRAYPLPTDRSRGDFWSKVLKTSCCWLWTRSRTGTMGYGAAWQDGRIVRAHRVAYELLVGPIPDGLDLLHECDVPLCVRPNHLRPGTRVDNQRDMVAKARHAPQDGEHNNFHKYDWAWVHAVRERAALGEPRRVLAAAFGTTEAYLYNVLAQRVWPESRCPVHSVEVAA